MCIACSNKTQLTLCEQFPLIAARFVGCTDALDTTLSSTEYKNWLRAQDKDVQAESGVIRSMILDVPFTSLCAEIAEFFDPALILLRIVDSDVPNVSKMVPGSANLKARMQQTPSRLPMVVQERAAAAAAARRLLVRARWRRRRRRC